MSSARCRGRTDLSEATLKRLLEEEGGKKKPKVTAGKKVQGPVRAQPQRSASSSSSAQPLWKAGGCHDRTKRGREVSCQPPRFSRAKQLKAFRPGEQHETHVVSTTVQRSWGASLAFLKNYLFGRNTPRKPSDQDSEDVALAKKIACVRENVKMHGSMSGHVRPSGRTCEISKDGFLEKRNVRPWPSQGGHCPTVSLCNSDSQKNLVLCPGSSTSV